MATRRRASVAWAAAAVVGGLLVVFELIVRNTSIGSSGARTPSSLVSEVVASTTSVQVSGWPALLVPVVVVLLLGLLIDSVSASRR